MKKHEIVRLLADHISPYLYSVGSPPKPLNDLFLNWIDNRVVPTELEVLKAINEADFVKVEV